MENRKIIVGVAALAALLLLFAGVGYAVFNGNARTYNEGNTDTLAYMTATPSDFSPFASDIMTEFDTYVYEGATYSETSVADESAYEAEVTAGTLYVKSGNTYALAVTGEYDDDVTYYHRAPQLLYSVVPVADSDEFTAAKTTFTKLYTKSGEVYTEANAYAESTTYYYKVDVQDKSKAYAFLDTPVTVDGYSAILLGTKDVTIQNYTDAAITSLNINVKVSEEIGTSDFVYIFKFVNGSNDAKYAKFYGTDALDRDVLGLTVDSIANEGGTGVVSVSLYVGYISNVFVPQSYIGAATPANTGSDYPYIVCNTIPASLDDVDFGFNFTVPQPVNP